MWFSYLMNIDDTNTLTCLYKIDNTNITKIYYLSHMYVIKNQ